MQESIPPPVPVDDDDMQGRIIVAWRELRRGASMLRLRTIVTGGPNGLDLGQLDTLELLVRRSRLRMSDLAEALRIDNSSATRAVARLVDAGLARREPSPGDARGVVVVATEAGAARWMELSERYRCAMSAMLAAFDAQEQVCLAGLLERLVISLDDWASKQPDPADRV